MRTRSRVPAGRRARCARHGAQPPAQGFSLGGCCRAAGAGTGAVEAWGAGIGRPALPGARPPSTALRPGRQPLPHGGRGLSPQWASWGSLPPPPPAHTEGCLFFICRGIVASILVFLCFGVTQAKDGPFSRPHPGNLPFFFSVCAAWRSRSTRSLCVCAASLNVLPIPVPAPPWPAAGPAVLREGG